MRETHGREEGAETHPFQLASTQRAASVSSAQQLSSTLQHTCLPVPSRSPVCGLPRHPQNWGGSTPRPSFRDPVLQTVLSNPSLSALGWGCFLRWLHQGSLRALTF